jgi:hypothetical protein
MKLLARKFELVPGEVAPNAAVVLVALKAKVALRLFDATGGVDVSVGTGGGTVSTVHV